MSGRFVNQSVIVRIYLLRYNINMSRASSSEKPLHWVGSSKKDLLAFLEEVIDDIGYALGVVQLGGTPPSAKPWKGEGPGVLEIVEDFRGDAYRAVYTVRFKEAVYVLHCFSEEVVFRYQHGEERYGVDS
jgi:phage-related protein